MEEEPCSCKGVRSCALCEATTPGKAEKCVAEHLMNKPSYVYCPRCDRAYVGWDIHVDLEAARTQHVGHDVSSQDSSQSSIRVEGILVLDDFLNLQEEIDLIKAIESLPWVGSQSGRQKQDFGPKVNFKKRKVRTEPFGGFPKFVDGVVAQFAKIERLHDFRPVELCHLRYDPVLGASIDPHLDDSWLWGERLVTVNLGAPTVLTLFSPDCLAASVVRVPMRPRSLVVLSADARYRWPHAVLRQDIVGVRWAMTFRELSPNFLPGGKFGEAGHELLRKATCTWKRT